MNTPSLSPVRPSDDVAAPEPVSEPHDHGHDHGHAHRHGHGAAHGGPQAGGRRRLATPGFSLLGASLAARLAVAGGLSALLWALVFWARIPVGG